jgi:hypothetical protein
MYTNIDATTGISSIASFLQSNERNLPTNFPSNLFLQILEIVMKNNIFSFANTYWLQLCGTAMGTPVACAYATLTFGHYENTVLLPTFSTSLLFYRRYIDDIFGIWLPPPDDGTTWKNFKETLNNWGKLIWTVKELSTQTNFLDLYVSVKEKSIVFSTYQKPLNLYLYIPPSSAHPTSCRENFKDIGFKTKAKTFRTWQLSSLSVYTPEGIPSTTYVIYSYKPRNH